MPSTTLGTREARTANLIRAYVAADYRWESKGEWRNLRIGEPAPELQEAYPQARHFGLLSAWDPWSVQRPEEINRLADESLQDDLAASGHPFCAAFSSASNRSWREPGWLVMDMPVAAFDTLSRRYAQLATLYWSAGGIVRLRVNAARPDGVSHDAIDWLEG